MWTLELGLAVARIVQTIVVDHGAHVGLTGGVLLRGQSEKDLDILIYPHDSSKGYNVYAIQVALKDEFSDWRKCEATKYHSRDGKEVWTTNYYGARVDFFFLMSERQENYGT